MPLTDTNKIYEEIVDAAKEVGFKNYKIFVFSDENTLIREARSTQSAADVPNFRRNSFHPKRRFKYPDGGGTFSKDDEKVFIGSGSRKILKHSLR